MPARSSSPTVTTSRERREVPRRRCVILQFELLELIPDESRVSVGESILEAHSHDLTYHPSRVPDAVVFPRSTEKVARVLGPSHAAALAPASTASGSGRSATSSASTAIGCPTYTRSSRPSTRTGSSILERFSAKGV